MLKISKPLVIAGIVLLIASCGNNSSSPSSQTTSTNFTASAGAGEILDFTVDTTALTYSYTVTESSYGLKGQTGSGTLTKNSDGSYTPSQFPTSKIQVYQNGIMVGAVEFTINGQTVNAPVVGLSSPITTLASLAGTYNFLGETCEGPTALAGVGACDTVVGTLIINSSGTYEACSGDDLTTHPSCASGTLTSGDVVSAGNGLFQFNKTGTGFVAVDNANYLLASAAPNGQNVLIIDTNDSSVGGYGYGHLVGSTQTSTVDTASAEGTWTWNANNGDSGTFDLTCSLPTVCTSSAVGNPTVTVGTPWAGLGTVSNNGFDYHVLLAGTGVYVQAAAPSQPAGGGYNYYMEVGAHQ
jgi:hypothetical protein